ncbi:VC0807 family protein [Streptomyces niger]|uniref:VC0807 family protein n=1 Tax=Streptomyces niger TaxID=66373 RepID=UPI000699D1CF|nr:VC0807 family protein [Streptomyces niger]
MALDLGVASLAYYGCVLAGLGTPPALLTATGVAAAWLVSTALYDRRADALAVGMLLMYGLSAAFAAATAEPRLLLLRDPLVSALAGLVFLGSCLSGTPATAYLARKLHGYPLDAPAPHLHRAHLRQTAVLGAGLTAEALARVVLVYALPVPTAAALTPPLEFAVLIPLLAWTTLQRRRLLPRPSAATVDLTHVAATADLPASAATTDLTSSTSNYASTPARAPAPTPTPTPTPGVVTPDQPPPGGAR